ncbi:nucleoside recognition domain-containing protein [Methanoculleus palmolei]|uniref:Nucleoside recognition domain-containing protein n=1 Tax=Methanoculleus palmolei TaxID=72612 RepID=A0ABD8A900_9EURY|nr:nucleoside recognition domain-containing protein [Methanoculleus palmolei]
MAGIAVQVISSAINAVLLVTVGVIVANILAEIGVFSRLSSLTGPLCRVSGLSDACVLSIVAMGVNATAGKSMLAEYYRDGKVAEREVIPVLIMGAFPVVLGESLFRVQLPTALVLLGPVVGGIYTGLNLFSSGIQALFAFLYSRRFLAGPGRAPSSVPPPAPAAALALNQEVVLAGCRKAVPTLRRVVPITLAALIAFALLSATGVMDSVAAAFDPLLRAAGLPGESAAALVAQFIHFSAGYAIVASLLGGGVLTLETALVTLVLGSMVVVTLIYVKYSVPLYLSLFGRFGVRVSLVTYAASMAAKVVTVALVFLLF